MKKLSRSQLEIALKLGLKRHYRSLKRKHRKPKKTASGTNVHSAFTGYIRLTAPDLISIYNISNEDGSLYTEAVSFCEDIRRHVGKEKCVISFEDTKIISAAAIVVIYAAIEEALQQGAEKSAIIWSKASPVVNRQLRNINLHLLIARKKITYNFRDNQSLPIVRGTANQYMDDIIDYVQQSVYENSLTPEEEHTLSDAVSEAINNVGLHAYPDADVSEKNWWLMCEVKDGQLYLAIYDTGVGIPKTVLEKKWFMASMQVFYPDDYKELKELVQSIPGLETSGLKAYVPKKLHDSQMIYLSMQGDITGTKKSKHGQGSKSIRALVDDTDHGKLWIFSNKGLYLYPANEDESGIFKLPKRLPGTLVQWNIKLS